VNSRKEKGFYHRGTEDTEEKEKYGAKKTMTKKITGKEKTKGNAGTVSWASAALPVVRSDNETR